MRELESDESPDLVSSLVELFRTSAPQIFKDFRTHLDRNEFSELNQAAHTFKSTCTNVGARRMGYLSSRLEIVKSTDETQAVLKTIDALESEFKIVVEELDKYVAA